MEMGALNIVCVKNQIERTFLKVKPSHDTNPINALYKTRLKGMNLKNHRNEVVSIFHEKAAFVITTFSE